MSEVTLKRSEQESPASEKIRRIEIGPVAAGRELELPNSARNTKNIFTLKMATV